MGTHIPQSVMTAYDLTFFLTFKVIYLPKGAPIMPYNKEFYHFKEWCISSHSFTAVIWLSLKQSNLCYHLSEFNQKVCDKDSVLAPKPQVMKAWLRMKLSWDNPAMDALFFSLNSFVVLACPQYIDEFPNPIPKKEVSKLLAQQDISNGFVMW